jgi:sensor c-di-GMP phosphodiesterase-like protein
VKAEVERELGFAKKIIDDGAKDASVNVDSSDLDKGTLSGTIKTDAYVSSKIDEEQIKTDLTGLNSEKADKYLKGIEGVEETRLEFFPSFLKIFPRLRNHIVIEIEVAEKETN